MNQPSRLPSMRVSLTRAFPPALTGDRMRRREFSHSSADGPYRFELAVRRMLLGLLVSRCAGRMAACLRRAIFSISFEGAGAP